MSDYLQRKAQRALVLHRIVLMLFLVAVVCVPISHIFVIGFWIHIGREVRLEHLLEITSGPLIALSFMLAILNGKILRTYKLVISELTFDSDTGIPDVVIQGLQIWDDPATYRAVELKLQEMFELINESNYSLITPAQRETIFQTLNVAWPPRTGDYLHAAILMFGRSLDPNTIPIIQRALAKLDVRGASVFTIEASSIISNLTAVSANSSTSNKDFQRR